MSDVEADLDRIEECADSLKRIHRTFTEGSNPADGYGVGDLGSKLIIDAFDEFSGNWKIHRQKLAEELQTLGSITAAAAEAYQKIDSDLAEALRGEDAKHTGPGSGQTRT